MPLLLKIIKDKKILRFIIILSGINGIGFSYYADGPFYLINQLGPSPVKYGLRFILPAIAGAIGGCVSKSKHKTTTSLEILKQGISIAFIGSIIFVLGIGTFLFFELDNSLGIIITHNIYDDCYI